MSALSSWGDIHKVVAACLSTVHSSQQGHLGTPKQTWFLSYCTATNISARCNPEGRVSSLLKKNSSNISNWSTIRAWWDTGAKRTTATSKDGHEVCSPVEWMRPHLKLVLTVCLMAINSDIKSAYISVCHIPDTWDFKDPPPFTGESVR